MLARVLYVVKVKIKRGSSRRGENTDNQCKTDFQKVCREYKKARFVVSGFPFFSCVRCARAFFGARARTYAVLVRTERRLVRFFFVLEEELRPPFCFYQQRFRAGNNPEPVTLLRSTVAVGSFCFAEAAGLQPVTHRERTRTTKAAGSTGSPHLSHSSSGIFFLFLILDKRSFVPLFPPFHHLSGGILFEYGRCDEPGDEPPTPGVFPNAGRNHRRTGDTGSEAGTRNREIRPQGAAEETESGGVDYRPADGPLRLRGKDTLTITGLGNPIEHIDQAALLSNWRRGSE